MFRYKTILLLIIGITYLANVSAGNGKNGTTKAPTTRKETTKAGPVTTATKPTKGPTIKPVSTSKPTGECEKLKTCDGCVDSYKCYWCGPSKMCQKWPKNSMTPKGCAANKWYWKQCTVPGYILIIVIPVLGVLILLTCGCCIYCKCCRVKSSNKEEQRIEQRRSAMKARHEARKQERQERSDLIRQKYGLLKSEDEEPLL